MGREISQRELRNDSGAIMRAVEAGESFTVTRNGRPIAELVPLRRRRFVPTTELREAFANAPALSYDELRDDLDTVIDQDFMPRA